MSTRLDPSVTGASAQVNARMTPDLLRVIDAEVVRIHKATKEPCDRSRALRAIVRAHGAERAVGASGAFSATAAESATIVRNVMTERDAALRKLDDAGDRIALLKNIATVTTKERDQAMRALSDEKTRCATLATANSAAAAEIERLKAERDGADADSATLNRDNDTLRAEIKRLRDALDAAARAQAAPVPPAVESAPVARKPRAPEVSPGLVHADLRTRWTALAMPLRAFVAAHGLPRTTFQRWAAGSDVVLAATFSRFAAAIEKAEQENSGNRA